MKKIAILIEDLFNERELIYPYYRLLEAGYEVHLVGPKRDAVYTSKSGLTEKVRMLLMKLVQWTMMRLLFRADFPRFYERTKATVDFVREMDKLDKPVAAICHGGWMLASACNLKGKKVTSFFSIKDDMVHAGAEYVDEEVVVSGNIITSRNPNDLPVFLKTIVEKLNQ